MSQFVGALAHSQTRLRKASGSKVLSQQLNGSKTIKVIDAPKKGKVNKNTAKSIRASEKWQLVTILEVWFSLGRKRKLSGTITNQTLVSLQPFKEI